MKGMLAVVLMIVAVGVLAPTRDAGAGVSVDVIFRGSGTSSTTVSIGNDPVGDVLISSTEPLTFVSVSVGWDTSNGITVREATLWRGVPVGPPPIGPYFAPLVDVEVDNPAGEVQFLNSYVPLPNPPNQAPPGTYNIGTIIWETRGATPYTTSPLSVFIRPAYDAIAVIRNGNIVDITSEVVSGGGLGTGAINFVPEPGTAALVGFGLVGLLTLRRRGR